MFGRTSLLKATALALPFSLAAAAAHAASIAETVQQKAELSTFAQAMAAAKFDQQLGGEGPYTVFAPSDQAFEQLPEGALDELMKQENQAQLTRLLEHHVIEGKAIATADVLGQEDQLDPMAGGGLTIDGTSQVVLIVPTGLQRADGQQGGAQTTTAQGSDMPMTEHQQQVLQDQAGQGQAQGQTQASGQGQAQAQQGGVQTTTAHGSDMPMTEHQQQALQSHPAPEQRQTAGQGTADMPATEHQQQVLQDQAGQGQAQGQQAQQQTQASGQQQAHGQMQAQGQQAGARTTTAEGSDMPMSPHQRQALESHPAPDQQQTAAAGTADMPASQHQQQVLQDQAGQGQEQQQSYEDAAITDKPGVRREATVVGADIQADNGVIHVIDAVLLPPDVLKMLEASKQR